VVGEQATQINEIALATTKLTPTDASLIDLERQKQAHEERRRVMNGEALPAPYYAHSSSSAEIQPPTPKGRKRGVLRGDPADTPDLLPGEHPWPPDYVAALTKPVRFEITFEHPMQTDRQLKVLAAVIRVARRIAHDLTIGKEHKRIDLRDIVKSAANILVRMQGKKPAGRRARG
jgi:hypothetical protein